MGVIKISKFDGFLIRIAYQSLYMYFILGKPRQVKFAVCLLFEYHILK